MRRVQIPKPISGGVMLSYKCSAACRHCMYACSPRWDEDWISEEDLARGLAQLAPHIQPSSWGRETMSLDLRTYLDARDRFRELAPQAFYAHLDDR